MSTSGGYDMKEEYKCYLVSTGCMGLVGPNQYQLFPTEKEYSDWFNGKCDEDE